MAIGIERKHAWDLTPNSQRLAATGISPLRRKARCRQMLQDTDGSADVLRLAVSQDRRSATATCQYAKHSADGQQHAICGSAPRLSSIRADHLSKNTRRHATLVGSTAP